MLLVLDTPVSADRFAETVEVGKRTQEVVPLHADMVLALANLLGPPSPAFSPANPRWLLRGVAASLWVSLALLPRFPHRHSPLARSGAQLQTHLTYKAPSRGGRQGDCPGFHTASKPDGFSANHRFEGTISYP